MVSATKPDPFIIDDSAALGPVTATLVGSTATEILGSAFNDLLTGSPQGGDLLVGGGGNDTLVSQGSNDTLSVTSGGDVFTFTNPTATGDLITHFQSDTDGIDLRPVLAAMNYQGSDPLNDGTISFASVSGGTAIMLSSDGNAADAHQLATVDGVSTLHPWDFYLPPPPPPPIQIDDSAATGPVTVDLSQAAPTIKTVLGSAFNDSLTGSVQGGDLLVGNGGNDTLVSQGSQDTMTGGAGGDIFTFASATATGSVITDFQSDTDGIDLRPVLAAMNYHGSDPLNDSTISFASVSGGTAIMLSSDGNAADAHLLATVDGVSTLHPWDFYLPVPPPVTVIDDSNASAGVTVDLGASGMTATTVIGSAFNDVLISNPNDGNLLVGGGGNDTLVSTGSNDTLSVTSGGDVFTFTNPTATGDLITHFQSDTDGIDLRPVLAAMNYQGSDPLNDGTISFASVSGGTAIMLSSDGNAADAHLLATVDGVSTLHPWDFYLPTAAVSPPPPPASPPPPPADPHTLWVGADQQYHTIADAVAASQGGDTIMVEAGTYENQTAIITHDLTIEGVGGFASFAWDDGLIPNGKAIFVVDANVTFENVELSGAAVDDGNGAGIRDEVGNLTVINSYIHDNQDGILSGTIPGGQVVLENSSFARNGIGDDQTHNVYIGHEASLVATGNYFFDAQGGADLKSRALTNTITANSFVDTHEYSTTGYAIDLSDGNDATVTDNFFHRDGRASNSNIIHYGGEVPDPTGSLLVENNYFESTRDSTTGVFNQTNLTSVDIADNQFNDVTQILNGPGTVETNNTSNFNVAVSMTDNPIAPVAGFGGLGYQLAGQAGGSVGMTVPPPPPPPAVDINDSAATGPVTVDLGATGQHSVLGSIYNDLLIGNPSGSSQLFGNDGNDTLVSQGSNDTMTGGAGGDVFTFNNPTATNSVVTDFQSDTDNIDLRPLLAAMNYTGTNPYADGHVTTTAVTGGTAIMVSPTGQAAAAHELVVVQGVSALQPWDFLH